jgi:RimJ/RimL family protein N-acetyltransferase
MTITFRALEPSDYPLFARWLAEPHVARWWPEPATVEHVREHYGGDPATLVHVAMADGRPMGIMQSYRVDDYPEHADSVGMPGGIGVDLFIGEPGMTGKGYGALMLAAFIEDVVRPAYPDATGVVADPEVANRASIRTLEKAGFIRGGIVPGEHGPEQIMRRLFLR